MKIIPIPNIGEVSFTKKIRSKHIRIRIKQDGTIAVSLPYFCTYLQAKKFVISKTDWIKKQTKKIPPTLNYQEIEDLRTKAKAYIPKRVAELSKRHHLPYNQIRIKNITSRWGSCSQKKNLNFSLHLMQFPKKYVDYVILHELAHTIEMNHGPKFWALLESICPNAKKIDREMKTHTKK